jgi:hypothetical protein
LKNTHKKAEKDKKVSIARTGEPLRSGVYHQWEIDFIKTNYGIMEIVDIARALNRNLKAMHSKINAMCDYGDLPS